ncbi:DUF3501 family protein [Sulfodiicoccus acidiphilus]|uniref:DUF3501 family protein n=1 Tax=Sulfodiicoccus acidiphilus TaxID=1670455 RepID=UPI0035713899
MKRIIEIKRGRRFELGDRLTLLFENVDTVAQQVQEMIYLDKLEDEKEIARTYRIYSTLLPCDGKVKATLYINAENEEDLRKVFKTLKGIYNSIYLKIGGKLIHGEPEGGREQGDEFSTVQYLTFDVGESSGEMEIVVDHPNYKVSVKLPEDLAKKLVEEAKEPCQKYKL